MIMPAHDIIGHERRYNKTGMPFTLNLVETGAIVPGELVYIMRWGYGFSKPGTDGRKDYNTFMVSVHVISNRYLRPRNLGGIPSSPRITKLEANKRFSASSLEKAKELAREYIEELKNVNS